MQSVYFYNVDDRYTETLFVPYYTFISADRRALIESYTFKRDKILCFVSELLLRCVACKCLDIRNSEIQIERDERGKPYLVGYPEFCFNIAHTESAVVMAVSQAAVGVDIEVKKELNTKIEQRFFAADEQRYINSGAKAERIDRALEIWTKKEAFVKCTGEGLSKPLCSFSVLDPSIVNRLYSFEISNYMISVCQESCSGRCDLIVVSNEMFFSVLQNLQDPLY